MLGVTHVDIVDKEISLGYGPNSILGRVIVVHQGVDDLGRGGNAGSMVSGNAGPRVACGIIEVYSNYFLPNISGIIVAI